MREIRILGLLIVVVAYIVADTFIEDEEMIENVAKVLLAIAINVIAITLIATKLGLEIL